MLRLFGSRGLDTDMPQDGGADKGKNEQSAVSTMGIRRACMQVWQKRQVPSVTHPEVGVPRVGHPRGLCLKYGHAGERKWWNVPVYMKTLNLC